MNAYFEFFKFSRNIRLKITNENFEKCIDVIDYIRNINKTIIEEKDLKLIYIINEA
jgi:hypothetical protein